jgi:hypothetical protein
MDIERAKSINMSTDWEEICKEIDHWILSQLERTKTCHPEQLGKIQATISAFEQIKKLPQVVIDRDEVPSTLTFYG